MQHSLLRRRFATSGSLLLCAASLVLGSLNASAQVLSRTQDFSSGTVPGSTAPTNSSATTTSLSFAVTGITNSGSYGYYSYSFAKLSTGGAFGVEDPNNSASPNVLTLSFAPQVFQANSTKNTITFQLGSSGFDPDNRVRVDVSLNGVTTQILTLTGPSGNGAKFGVGEGSTAVVDFPTAQNLTMGGSGTGSAVINLPDFTARTTVGLTITISAAKKAVNIIDNVAMASGSPLPVELTRFDATAKGPDVHLSWATASEKNNDRFEVQRSAAGSEYATIGTVKGQGSATAAHAYAFVDSRPLAGPAYYRLRQVDFDGTAAYSPVALVKGAAHPAALAFPNPSEGVITLAADLGAVTYRVYNHLGQSVLHGQATGGTRLSVAALPKGPFFLELTGPAGRSTERLMRD